MEPAFALAVLLVAFEPPAVAGTETGAERPESAGQPQNEPEPRMIDMVVAQVDATVITLSELVSETRLVLLRTGGPEVARAGTLSQELLDAVLRSIVVRELLLGEIRRLKLPDVPDPEVEAALKALRHRFASNADYDRFLDKSGFREPGGELMRGFDAPPSLIAIILAELQVERFLDVRVKRNVAVRERDVTLCVEANRKSLDGLSSRDAEKLIRGVLEEQRERRAFEVLVDQLEKRATVRTIAPFRVPRRTDEGAGAIRCPEPARLRTDLGQER